MMGNPVNKNSQAIMHLIEEGSVGAEIGVWEGSSSKKFTAKKPKLLYLVDPWAVSGYDETRAVNDPTHDHEKYINRYKRLVGGDKESDFDRYYDKVYERVQEKFSGNPAVKIKRMTSTEFFNSYEGEKLDWIYIDGDHSYSAVLKDLNGALRIVKKGGLILGDDFRFDSQNDKGGVKQATREFAETHGYEIHRHGHDQFRIVV